MATTALYLSSSALANAEATIDQLLAQAQQLEQAMTLGVQSAAGVQSYTYEGQVVQDGSVKGYIEQQYVEAYNSALQDVQNHNYQNIAEQVVDAAIMDSMQDLHQGVDNLVEAVVEMSTVFAVADLAEEAKNEADNSQQVQDQEALQEYVIANDVEIEQADVDQYNESLNVIEEAAQSAAVFISIAQDQEFTDSLNEDLQSFNADVASVQLQYNQSQDALMVSFMGAAGGPGTLDYFNVYEGYLQKAFVQESDVLIAGQQSAMFGNFEMFKASSGQGEFGGNNYEIPPNVLLFTGDPRQGGWPEAYTDENGNIIYYEPGDDVYDPMDGSYVGFWHPSGDFIWDQDYYNRFA